ncbi:hypothetical protein BDQ12DRAFT_708197 [Crucibulum laeve]|uniref:DUF6535 domain-containing protein n=1 Tax=Crucibulum laeve TaxID=68775 RepID=A0A5C3MG24_9AGAR|nr:hypothetical protein BDQ12DRAFT_708197 [Crucibulum laeve]
MLSHKCRDTSSQEYIESEEEISEFSLVWVVYNEEATRADASLADGSNRGMDVLLVFTGLFSAVLTTFIIQSYQLLLPDDATVTNQLLALMLALQLNSSVVPDYFTSANFYQIANATSSNTRIFWVNGLCLSTALVSMLAKHWLQAYISDIHGSPRQQARERLLVFIWTTSMGIVLPTFVIVGLVYIFYMISIWLSIFHPDSPFQHPISSHLRKERSLAPSSLSSSNAFSRSDFFITDNGHQKSKLSMSCALLRNGDERPSSEHRIDACALIWLFGRSNGSETAAIALKSIANFPRDFTAFNLLRDANAIAFVLRGFQMCFHRDTTAGINWNVKDSQAACIYCKSWLKLTRETTVKWPTDLWDPLEQLSRLEHNPNAAAIASCVLALASLDDHLAQWNLLSILGRFSRKEIQLSQSSQMWLLDTLLECSLTWELPTAVLRETSHKAIPILLSIMHSSRLSKMSTITSVVGLCIHTLTGGILDLSLYNSEIRRREHYCELVVPALSIIVDNPSQFGIKDDTLQDYIGLELSRLVSLVFYQPMMFPDGLKHAARTSISQLFLDGRLEVDSIDKDILADVLRLLFPPTAISMQRRPAFTKTLLRTLSKSHHPGVNACQLLGFSYSSVRRG